MAVNSKKRNQSGKGRAGGPYPAPKPGGKKSRNDVRPEELVDAFKADAMTLSLAAQARLQKVNRRTWMILLVMFAVVVLVWAMVMMLQYALSNRGPMLLDALAAPYDLEALAPPQPGVAPEMLLPAAVGEYTLQTDIAPSVGRLGECLFQAGLQEAACKVSYRPQLFTSGEYHASAELPPVTVVAAQFYDEAQATQAMTELFQHSRSTGRVGNYALRRIRPVDYFYSSSSGGYAFTWSSGPYIYTVSAASLADINRFLEKFTY